MAWRNLYEILQVDRRAEQEVIEAAYRRLALKYHPDVSRAPDADRRMKEITRAYAVLGDPHHRAEYDRGLCERDPTPAEAARHHDRGAPPPACQFHPASLAAGVCRICGRTLCDDCVDRFTPPTCRRCVLAWVGRRRLELLGPVLWFVAALLTVGVLVLSSLGGPDIPPSRTTVIALLAGTYVVASVPCGWRVWSAPDEPTNFWASLLGAAVVGPVIAPFRIVKILAWDMRHVGRLAARAKDV